MKNWKTHARKTVLDCGKFLKVEFHDVEFDDGTRIKEWPWIVTPNYINVVLEMEDGDFLVYRQSKYALDGDSWAIVGGYIEPDEDPLEAAKRETLEETGCEAPTWISLGSYVIAANRGFATSHFYLARGARQIADPDADDLETYEIHRMTRDELTDAIKSAEFKALPWASAVALALLHLD